MRESLLCNNTAPPVCKTTWLGLAGLVVLLGCGNETSNNTDGASNQGGSDLTYTDTSPATELTLGLNASDQATLDTLTSDLADLEDLSTTALLDAHELSYNESLGYDPGEAEFLPLLQASSLALNEAELERLRENGFVIAPRHSFPYPSYAYESIYGLDLPVYISVDTILETVHRSYDEILKQIEYAQLIDELTDLFAGARTALRNGVITDPQTAADLDLFFAVGASLLHGQIQQPAQGADLAEIEAIVQGAEDANGIYPLTLFGTVRSMDFSQFKPRGHYTESDALSQYFRALIWLGRTDLRMIETLPSGATVLRRRQLEAVLAMKDVMAGTPRIAYDNVDRVISAFVGEHDYMTLPEVEHLEADLGGDISTKSDQEIADAIINSGYGAQRIASQVLYRSPGASGTLPLDRSFALLGQRYVVDSHVFSNVVYDRVSPNDANETRQLPLPLDVAYAGLGNDAALPLLQQELAQYEYAPHLEQVRTLVDGHGASYWDSNLYNLLPFRQM